MTRSANAARTKKLPAALLIPLDTVRTRLAILWGIFASVIFVVLVLQSLMDRYKDKTQEVWGWLLPTIMPTLTLIITVLSYTALDPLASRAVVRKTFYRLAAGMSAFYLLLVLLTILMQPFTGADAELAAQQMRTSNLWLGPLQGLVAAALGVLFVSKRPEPGAEGS